MMDRQTNIEQSKLEKTKQCEIVNRTNISANQPVTSEQRKEPKSNV